MTRRERDPFDDLPILGELRDALAAHMGASVTAAAPAPGAHARRHARTWALAGARRAGLALAVLVALAVVAVGLVAVHHRTASPSPDTPAGHGSSHSSIPTGPAPPAAGGDIARAQRQTIAHDRACAQTANRGQTIDHGAPPESMLSVLGVLRRPALAPDPTNKVLHSIGWDAGAGVYVNYIRRARTEYGRSYWLVPEARTTPFGPIPARCYGEFRATLKHDLRHASAATRTRELGAQQQQLGAERQESEHRQGLCFIEIGLRTRPHPGAVGFGCGAAATEANPLSGGDGSGDTAGGTIQSGVVPDGFVAVTAHYPAVASAPALTLTSDVVNNVYVLKVPRRPARAQSPDQWRLRRADGGVLTVSGVKAPPAGPVQRTHSVQHGGGGGPGGGGGGGG
jgi:hypothetical protein